MKSEYRTRFGTAPWADKCEDIVLGGAGGIGSWLALALARIGHNLYVYDMDSYDSYNLAGQFCTESDIDKEKTESLKQNIKSFTGNTINTYGEYKKDSSISNIMISAFDNMEARKIMFENWKSDEDRELFLDGRMTAEFFEVFAVTKENEDKYEKDFLFPSSEANILPCSFKSTTHNAMGIAYIMTGLLNNFLLGEYKQGGLRELPFHTRMDIGIMMFEVND